MTKIHFDLSINIIDYNNIVDASLTIIDGNIDLDSRLDVDAGDLLHDITRGVKVDQPLVNPHFEAVPGVGTLSRRSLASGNLELLSGETDGSLHVELLVNCSLLQVSTDLLEVLDIARGQGNADAVHLGAGILEASFLLSGGDVRCHFENYKLYAQSLPTNDITNKRRVLDDYYSVGCCLLFATRSRRFGLFRALPRVRRPI